MFCAHTHLSMKVIFTRGFLRVMDGCCASLLIQTEQLLSAKDFSTVSEVKIAFGNSAQLQDSVAC